jgi:hypothetical protein
MFGAMVKGACCAACANVKDLCLDDDGRISGLTAFKTKTCAEAVNKGLCFKTGLHDDISSEVWGPEGSADANGNRKGGACCKSCQEQIQLCPDNIKAVSALSLGQLKSCELPAAMNGCHDNGKDFALRPGFALGPIMVQACCASCKKQGKLQMCLDQDDLIRQLGKSDPEIGKTIKSISSAPCKLIAKAGECQNKKAKGKLMIACCKSCNPEMVSVKLVSLQGGNLRFLCTHTGQDSFEAKPSCLERRK